jgi:hypothetical protein
VGEPREKIIADNNIGAGTVSIIVDDYKAGLDSFDLDSFRELTIEAKKRGMTPNDLASFFRVYNFFRGSGAKENEIESFITNINSGYIPPGKAIELINQIYEISKSESVPPDQLPNYVRQKVEEKQTLDEHIKEADAILQSKNVGIEAINEHIQLKEELKKYRLSTKDIHRLVNFLSAVREYKYSPGKIVAKLRNIKRLETKEVRLKSSVEAFSKKEAKYKDVIPFTEDLVSFGLGIQELIGLKVAIKESVMMYNLPFFHSTMRLIDDIKKYNKINWLNRELERLSLQKYALDQACSHQSQSLIALSKLKSYGVTEDRILQLNNILENNRYKANSYGSTK